MNINDSDYDAKKSRTGASSLRTELVEAVAALLANAEATAADSGERASA